MRRAVRSFFSLLGLLSALSARVARAQQGAPTPPPSPQPPGAPAPVPQPPPPPPPSPPAPIYPAPAPSPIAAYRQPVIAVVHPLASGMIPEDKPVIVLRFAPGEVADALDTRSLAVTVDGEDRTALFQLTGAEAWGPIAAATAKPSRGAHEIRARICSARGACATTKATVIVGPSVVADKDRNATGPTRKSQILDVVIDAAKRLLKP